MSHLLLFDLFLHLLVPLSLIYPAFMAYKISKRVKGVLMGLWLPFERITLALLPLAIFHVIEVFHFIKEFNYVTNTFYSIIEHGIISIMFLVIGYSFSNIEKLLENYGVMISDVGKTR